MTVWRGVVWNAACDSKTGITAGTHAELMARIEAGQAAGHLGGIIMGAIIMMVWKYRALNQF